METPKVNTGDCRTTKTRYSTTHHKIPRMAGEEYFVENADPEFSVKGIVKFYDSVFVDVLLTSPWRLEEKEIYKNPGEEVSLPSKDCTFFYIEKYEYE